MSGLEFYDVKFYFSFAVEFDRTKRQFHDVQDIQDRS